MKSIRKFPPPHLAGLVRYYWFFETYDAEQPFIFHGFPYGSFEIIFFKKNPLRMRWGSTSEDLYQPELFYAGQLTKPYTLYFDKPTVCAGISFQHWAGQTLCGIPASELNESVVDYNLISGDTTFRDKLQNCEHPEEIFNCFSKHLDSRLASHPIDPLCVSFVKKVTTVPDLIHLNKAIAEANLSRRRIEQRVSQHVGLSPLGFLKKMRFQKSLQLLKRDKTWPLNNIVSELDYYDHAHFNHEFKSFAGISPGQYLKSRSSVTDFFQSLSQDAQT